MYWSVRANHNGLSSDTGPDIWFGIDLVTPSCSIQALDPVNYENVFQVNWSANDLSAGVRSYDIQYRDSSRDTWNDWLLDVPASKPYELFTGMPGHTYYFRCRATDNAGNTNAYPADGDTFTKVDLSARPAAGWWDETWAAKYNLTILNNMPGLLLPAGYPVHLHFDSGTSPTAAQVFAASLSTPKCNDLRIVANDTTEVDRKVDRCDATAIDMWFRTQVGIPAATSDNVSHQLYFGNASAGAAPSDRSNIFYPAIDANHLRVLDIARGRRFYFV